MFFISIFHFRFEVYRFFPCGWLDLDTYDGCFNGLLISSALYLYGHFNTPIPSTFVSHDSSQSPHLHDEKKVL